MVSGVPGASLLLLHQPHPHNPLLHIYPTRDSMWPHCSARDNYHLLKLQRPTLFLQKEELLPKNLDLACMHTHTYAALGGWWHGSCYYRRRPFHTSPLLTFLELFDSTHLYRLSDQALTFKALIIFFKILNEKL